MRVLITGGAGFVGSNLIAALQKRGRYRVVVLDNEALGRRDHIADLSHEFILGDIRDPETVDRALNGVEAVVHLAADTRVIPSIEDPAFNFETNVVGSFTLLQAMRRRGVKRLINASTGGAIAGDVDPPVHEDMPPQPKAPYGASKLAVEGYCSAFSASYGMRCLSLRFSNVYGPRSFHKGSVVAQFLKLLLKGDALDVFGDGSQTRDYVYVGDLCEGIVAAIESDASGVLQLGTGKPTSINELIDTLRSVTGLPVETIYHEFRDGEVRQTYCSIVRAKRAIGYNPVTTLAQGLTETWPWFQDNRKRFVA